MHWCGHLVRKANNTVSFDSTHNSKLLLYTVNVSDPPSQPSVSFVINMSVSSHALRLRDSLNLFGILLANDDTRGFICAAAGAAGDTSSSADQSDNQE